MEACRPSVRPIASSPQFFKIVTQNSLEYRQLVIPKKFISRYGKTLSSPVFLKLPDNTEWRVELTTSNGLVLLCDGWQEFAEYFSLEHGSFLVFRYDGNSSFHVTIFQKTGLEIEYPCKDANNRCKFKGDREFPDDDSVETLDELPKQRQKMSMPTLPHCQPCKKMRKEDSYGPNLKLEGEHNTAKDGCEGMNDSKKHSDHEVVRRGKPLPAAVKVEGPQSSGDLTPEDLTFKVVMRQSYVQGRFSMVIPVAFARRHLRKERGTIAVQNLDGKTWSLEYIWRKRFKAYVSIGWKEFAQCNFLKEGDIGVFKLIQQDKFLFTKEENSSPPPAEVKLENSGRDNINAKVDERENSIAKVEKRRQSHAIIQQDKMLFTREETSAPLQVKLENGERHTIDAKVDERENIDAKVDEHRRCNHPSAREGNSGGTSNSGICGIKEDPDGKVLPSTENELAEGLREAAPKSSSSRNLKAKAVGAATELTTNKPFFEVQLSHHDIVHSYVNVPGEFGRKHFSQYSKQFVKLYAKSQRQQWKVKLKKYHGRYRLSAGWRAFLRENSLQEGDICIFEIISLKDGVLKVTIFNHMRSRKLVYF